MNTAGIGNVTLQPHGDVVEKARRHGYMAAKQEEANRYRRHAEMQDSAMRQEAAYRAGAEDTGRKILAGLNQEQAQQQAQFPEEEQIASLLVDAQNGSQKAGQMLDQLAQQPGMMNAINAVAEKLNNAQGTNGGDVMPSADEVANMIAAAESGDKAAGDALNALGSTPEGQELVNQVLQIGNSQQATREHQPAVPQAGMPVR